MIDLEAVSRELDTADNPQRLAEIIADVHARLIAEGEDKQAIEALEELRRKAMNRAYPGARGG